VSTSRLQNNRIVTDWGNTGAFLPVLAWTLPKGKTMLPFDRKLDPRPAWKRALRMDWIGALLCVGWVTCLGISLQWGGITKKWNSTPVLVVSQQTHPMFHRNQLKGDDLAFNPHTSFAGGFHWLVDMDEISSHATHPIASIKTSLVTMTTQKISKLFLTKLRFFIRGGLLVSLFGECANGKRVSFPRG